MQLLGSSASFQKLNKWKLMKKKKDNLNLQFFFERRFRHRHVVDLKLLITDQTHGNVESIQCELYVTV